MTPKTKRVKSIFWAKLPKVIKLSRIVLNVVSSVWVSFTLSPFKKKKKKRKIIVVLTINKHNGLLDGMLVTKLRIEQRSADKGAIVSGLVPAHVQMVNVDVTQ